MAIRFPAEPLTVAPPVPTDGLTVPEDEPEEAPPDEELPALPPVTAGAEAGFFFAVDDSSFVMV